MLARPGRLCRAFFCFLPGALRSRALHSGRSAHGRHVGFMATGTFRLLVTKAEMPSETALLLGK
jgi:hypothetical protein